MDKESALNIDMTDITIVLDRSGSMGAVREDTIGGFNTYLDEQKSAPGQAALTLVQFDNEYEVVYDAVPIKEAQDLTGKTYVPRGSTALLDAIGRAMTATGARIAAMPEGDRPAQVLFVIMTDGQENASVEYTRERIFEMITHQREKYDWQIVFIGANQDAVATGAGMGIASGNSLTYAGTGAGTKDALRAMSASTTSYRKREGGQKAGFFDSGDNKSQGDEKK